jgi:hypothetical protein
MSSGYCQTIGCCIYLRVHRCVWCWRHGRTRTKLIWMGTFHVVHSFRAWMWIRSGLWIGKLFDAFVLWSCLWWWDFWWVCRRQFNLGEWIVENRKRGCSLLTCYITRSCCKFWQSACWRGWHLGALRRSLQYLFLSNVCICRCTWCTAYFLGSNLQFHLWLDGCLGLWTWCRNIFLGERNW